MPSGDGWTQIKAAVFSAAWSPDSNNLLVALTSGVARLGVDPIVGFEVRDHAGNLIDKVLDQDPLGWLDDTHILAYQGLGDSSDEKGYAANAHASIIALDGSDPHPVDIPYGDGPLVSGHGAVAIAHFRGNIALNVPRYDFRVWSGGEMSDVHDGYPFEWSPDGTKLAVYHSFQPTRGPDGWLEVLSWPGLQTVYEDLPHQQVGNVSFDPTSKFVTFERDANETDIYPPTYVRVASLDTATVADLPLIPPQTGVGWFWEGSVLKVIISGTPGEHSWDAYGHSLGSRMPPRMGGEASQDGSTAIYWDGGDTVTNFVVERGGQQTAYDLPSAFVYFPSGVLAPDGSAIALAGDDVVYMRNL